MLYINYFPYIFIRLLICRKRDFSLLCRVWFASVWPAEFWVNSSHLPTSPPFPFINLITKSFLGKVSGEGGHYWKSKKTKHLPSLLNVMGFKKTSTLYKLNLFLMV